MSAIHVEHFNEQEKLTIANAVGEVMAETTYLNLQGIPLIIYIGSTKFAHASIAGGKLVGEVVLIDGGDGLYSVDQVVAQLAALDQAIKVAAAEWLEAQQQEAES